MKYFVTIGDREVEVDLGTDGMSVDGEAVTAGMVEMDGSDVHSLLLGQKSYRVLASMDRPSEWALHLYGHRLNATVVDERTRRIQSMVATPDGPKGPKPLRAPMPGLVVKLEVAEGDTVSPGQGLVIVEAMKMENEIKSEGGGRIQRIFVEPGQVVEKDQILVEFEPPEATPEKGSGE